MAVNLIAELEKNWKWSSGDPEEIFLLEEEIASGSFGSVYKVSISQKLINCIKTNEITSYNYILGKTCCNQ